MSKIVSFSLGFLTFGENTGLTLYLHIKGGKHCEKNAPYITCITLQELLKMTDFTKTYNLQSGFVFTPKYYNFLNDCKDDAISFEMVLADALRMAYATNSISRDAYIQFALAHYDQHYCAYYRECYRRDLDFFTRYLENMLEVPKDLRIPESLADEPLMSHTDTRVSFISVKSAAYNKLIKHMQKYMHSVGVTGYKTMKIPGKFYGCFTDDDGRKRPLTSQVQYEIKYPERTVFKSMLTDFLYTNNYQEPLG